MSFIAPWIDPGQPETADPLPVTKVARSLKFYAPEQPCLSRVFTNVGSSKKFTAALWFKRTVKTAAFQLLFGSVNAQDSLVLTPADGLGMYIANVVQIETNAKFLDTTQWYHVVMASDTTQAVAADRVKIWVNGVRITSFLTGNFPALNYDFVQLNAAVEHRYGRYAGNGYPLDALLADCYFIDGAQLDPTAFVKTDPISGQLVSIAFTGAYGANGFHLDFADNSAATAAALGKDRSPNGNNWTPNLFTVAVDAVNDSLFDSPADYDDGIAHGGMSELITGCSGGDHPVNSVTAPPALREGRFAYNTGGNNGWSMSALMMRSGLWYCEVTSCVNGMNGVLREDHLFSGNTYPGNTTLSWSLECASGNLYNAGVLGGNQFSALIAADILNIAFDANTGKIWYGKNGVWSGAGNPATGVNPAVTVTLSAGKGWRFLFGHNIAANQDVNFGQRPFNYAPPAGFKALCALNLPAAVITSGTFVGNAAANGPIVDLGGPPSAMTINGNAVVFGTHARKLAVGVKILVAATSHNTNGSNTFTAVVPLPFKYSRAQVT